MIKIKVAIITDIHGNSIALKEVLKDAKNNNVDDYIYLGDLVNELPFGNETLELIRKTSKKVLKGNKEQYLIDYDKDKYNWENIQFKNVKFMYNELSEDNLEYIKGLPYFMNVEYEGVKLLVAHGSPFSVQELLYHNELELINKYTINLDADALIIGHTHEKVWFEKYNNKLVINAGCCGVSPYYVGQAEYVILNIENRKITNVEMRLVNYDMESVKNKIIKSGILDIDKILMNLTYNSMNGNAVIKKEFLHRANLMMNQKGKKIYRDDAKGIYKYFKLYDDDIWLSLAEEYKKYFVF